MRLEAAGLSDQGPHRAANDDHFLVAGFIEQTSPVELAFGSDADFFRRYGLLVAVADGMGGYQGGGRASYLALEVLQALYYATDRSGFGPAQFRDGLRGCLEQTKAMVAAALQREPELAEAGTTLAGIALLPPEHLLVFHAGDSRVLRYCAGYLRALTVDHSAVGAAVASNRLSETAAAQVTEGHGLTRSLGAQPAGDIELSEPLTWQAGDTFLLGSDGWHGLGRGLSSDALTAALASDAEPGEMVERLLAGSRAADGSDNATVVVVRVAGEKTRA